jgi:hypothetical protein
MRDQTGNQPFEVNVGPLHAFAHRFRECIHEVDVEAGARAVLGVFHRRERGVGGDVQHLRRLRRRCAGKAAERHGDRDACEGQQSL